MRNGIAKCENASCGGIHTSKHKICGKCRTSQCKKCGNDFFKNKPEWENCGKHRSVKANNSSSYSEYGL